VRASSVSPSSMATVRAVLCRGPGDGALRARDHGAVVEEHVDVSFVARMRVGGGFA
jgi:hypothetical protein